MAFLPRDKERGICKSGKRPYFVAQARDFGGHVEGLLPRVSKFVRVLWGWQ